jgi:hypothetical protein
MLHPTERRKKSNELLWDLLWDSDLLRRKSLIINGMARDGIEPLIGS